MTKVKSPTKPLAMVDVLPQPDGQNKIVVRVVPDPDCWAIDVETRVAIGLVAGCATKRWYGCSSVFGIIEPNHMESIARKLGGVLCSQDRNDSVQLFYWATGIGGDLEDIGTYRSSELPDACIDGVDRSKWGRGRKLLPAIKTIVEGGGTAPSHVMGVILTDSIIEDEAECMEYCMSLGESLVKNRDVRVKLIMIAIGYEVDADQLARFDDMFEGTELEDDDVASMWSCGLVDDIRNEDDILDVLFGELATEDMIVAPSGRVLDPDGNLVKHYADGLPGKFQFMLPAGCSSFTLQAGGSEVVQDLSTALCATTDP